MNLTFDPMNKSEGPIAHSQPAYARVPGIRVYGMTCRLPMSQRTGKDFLLKTSTSTSPSTTTTKVEASSKYPPHLILLLFLYHEVIETKHSINNIN
jgi:hypothetical protein